jgi:protein TonB
MNTRFVLPAAVAMALHAFALFGFRPAPAQPPSHSDPAFVCGLSSLWVEPLPVPPESDSDSAITARGSPDVMRSDEPVPPSADDRLQISIPAELPRPGPINPLLAIPSGPIGDPNGSGSLRSGPVDFTQLDNPPRTRLQIPPAYPYEASRDGRRGDVLVRFTVDEMGRVVDPYVIRSSDPVFEEPTLRAVAKWRFEPGRKNGRAVRFQLAVPVQFTVTP